MYSLVGVPSYFFAIIRQESLSASANQFFVTDKLPYQTHDNGFGLLMLTTPPPDYNELFNWQDNVKAGLALFNDKLASARRHIPKQKEACKNALGANCPLIPTKTYGNCVFSDEAGASLTFVDAVAIKCYNGCLTKFVVWDGPNLEWKFNEYGLTKEGTKNYYVRDVCLKVRCTTLRCNL